MLLCVLTGWSFYCYELFHSVTIMQLIYPFSVDGHASCPREKYKHLNGEKCGKKNAKVYKTFNLWVGRGPQPAGGKTEEGQVEGWSRLWRKSDTEPEEELARRVWAGELEGEMGGGHSRKRRRRVLEGSWLL